MTTYYDATVLADSPLRLYSCGEASGGFADTSGNSHNGTPTGSGSVSYGQTALLNSEATLSAKITQGEYISVPTNGFPTGVDAGGFAMECWMRAGTLRNAFDGVMGYGTEVATQAFDIAISNVNVLYAKVNGGTAILGPTAVPNTVYHLVMSFDGTTMTFYVNAVSQGTTNPTVAIVAGGAAFNAFADGSSAVGWTFGKVAFYGAALSAARVLAHYDAGIATLASGGVIVPVALSGVPRIEVIGLVASPVALSGGNPRLYALGSILAPASLVGNPHVEAVGNIASSVRLLSVPHFAPPASIDVPVTLGGGLPIFDGAYAVAVRDAPYVTTTPTDSPYVVEEVTP